RELADQSKRLDEKRWAKVADGSHTERDPGTSRGKARRVGKRTRRQPTSATVVGPVDRRCVVRIVPRNVAAGLVDERKAALALRVEATRHDLFPCRPSVDRMKQEDALKGALSACRADQIQPALVVIDERDFGTYERPRGKGSLRPRVASIEGAKEMRRSEEHTSELQSRVDLVCRLLLEKQ